MIYILYINITLILHLYLYLYLFVCLFFCFFFAIFLLIFIQTGFRGSALIIIFYSLMAAFDLHYRGPVKTMNYGNIPPTVGSHALTVNNDVPSQNDVSHLEIDEDRVP